MMTKNSKKYDGEICEFGEFSYYKFHVDVYHRYNIEAITNMMNFKKNENSVHRL